MNSKEYLAELESKLKILSEEDRNDALKFYGDYFYEAGPEKEQEVIKQLGSPVYVAAQIAARISEEQKNNKETKGISVRQDFKTLWLILLGILAAPFALPVLFAVIIILFVFLIITLSIIFALFSAGIGLLFGGIAEIFGAITGIFAGFAQALFLCGLGFVKFAIGGFILLASWYCIKFALKTAVKLGNKLLKQEKTK
jgi:uncharacterized membrane protein